MTDSEQPPSTVTIPRPTPLDLDGAQRREMLDWLAANGIPNRRVWCVELLTVDLPMVAVTRNLAHPDTGTSYLDPATTYRRIAQATSDHLIRVPPPAWWQPGGSRA